MTRLFSCGTLALLALLLVQPDTHCADAAEGLPYTKDFAQDDIGKELADMGFVPVGETVLKVVEQGGERCAELTPVPLDTFGFLFGPALVDGFQVRARVWAVADGRRKPAFALGSNGVGGWMLRLTPIRSCVEILKGEEVKALTPCSWTSGTWTMLSLVVRKQADGKWLIAGKAWEHGKPEPADWLIRHETTEQPVSGKASLWGMPYSEQPLRYDDLAITAVKE